jgi:serine/threonine protein kinase
MPSPASTKALLDLLHNSRLLEEPQLADYLKRLPDLPLEPRAAAQTLVNDGLITAFQARHLLRGRYKGFFLLGGQYKVLKPIGRGGMGTVFLCEHLKLRRLAAVKILPRAQAKDKVSLERFQREARAAAALDHPNIVRVYDVSPSPDLALLVMEYVEGKTLQEIMDREGAIPYGQAVGYAMQAAAGLRHAHERGIIHRDIKPGNLLVDRNGTVKVLDMGLARFLDKDDRLTQDFDGAAILGTPDYMSPEQATAGSRIDSRTDIYSLGATLYALLCGRTPFAGSTSEKILALQVREPVPAHRVRDEVPEALSAVVARMMAKDPARRYATAAEVIAALAPFADAPPQAASTVRLPHVPGRQPRSRRPLLLGAGASLLLLGTAMGLWLMFSQQPSGAPAGASPDPATRPDQPAGKQREKERYRLNLEKQPPLLARIENRQFVSNPSLPEGWVAHCWKEESVAEALVERVGGSLALGFRNLSGDPTCQLCFNLATALGGLEQGRKYLLRIEYQGQKESNGAVYVRRSDFTSFASGTLRPTDGRWDLLEVAIEQDAAMAQDVTFCTSANGPATTIFIRSFVLVERGE